MLFFKRYFVWFAYKLTAMDGSAHIRAILCILLVFICRKYIIFTGYGYIPECIQLLWTISCVVPWMWVVISQDKTLAWTLLPMWQSNFTFETSHLACYSVWPRALELIILEGFWNSCCDTPQMASVGAAFTKSRVSSCGKSGLDLKTDLNNRPKSISIHVYTTPPV
jgi:hypothetical protein